MLNLVQHLTKSMCYETLKQVQGDKSGLFTRPSTLGFAKKVRAFVKRLSKTIGNIEDVRQLVKASGSIGANYIEANEALS
jgi:hypothetical protein